VIAGGIDFGFRISDWVPAFAGQPPSQGFGELGAMAWQAEQQPMRSTSFFMHRKRLTMHDSEKDFRLLPVGSNF
jgi:hypothetical protein